MKNTKNTNYDIDFMSLELKMTDKRKTETRRKNKAEHKKFKPVKY